MKVQVTMDDPRPPNMTYHPARYFSWMEADYPSICPDAKAVLEELGFSCSYDGNGDLLLEDYDKKQGQEDLFLNEISDLIPKECWMVWRGEDSAVWAWEFDGSRIIEKSTR